MASSRGKPAYAAIMLALTLVIMAAIVGLLILMLYLCTNIAYKFIPAKTKKNVKRMFTRKKDGAAADDDSPIPAGAGAGGNLFDYLLCRKSCRYPGGYVKDDRPRCVQPETHNISRPSIRSIVDVFHAEGFSTMRRFDSTFDTTDPHEAFKPPADGDADAPAEPETEREEAVDDAPAAPDEASSDP